MQKPIRPIKRSPPLKVGCSSSYINHLCREASQWRTRTTLTQKQTGQKPLWHGLAENVCLSFLAWYALSTNSLNFQPASALGYNSNHTKLPKPNMEVDLVSLWESTLKGLYTRPHWARTRRVHCSKDYIGDGSEMRNFQGPGHMEPPITCPLIYI